MSCRLSGQSNDLFGPSRLTVKLEHDAASMGDANDLQQSQPSGATATIEVTSTIGYMIGHINDWTG
jgi:hypothetical protein